MWKWIAIFLALVLIKTEARATEGDGLHALLTGDDARGWRAVGRVELGGRAFCTGSLVAEDLVLTAAHCLHDPATGAPFAPGDIRFLADLRAGRASAYRGVRAAVAHPLFDMAAPTAPARAAYDIALLRLDQPIRNRSIAPFATGPWPRRGEKIGVVSYAHDRADSPSLEEGCAVLAHLDGALILSCQVDFGSSGAPVFSFEGGVARVVSVISAKAEAAGRKVSIASQLDGPLQELLALIGPSPLRPAAAGTPRVLRLGNGMPRHETGARFIRP